MSFESGSVSFRAFYMPQALPADAIERFASRALPPTDTMGPEPVSGWVTGRHLQDRNITEETARYAGYLRLALCRAERKIPESTLRAECRMEELARMQAEGRSEIDRRTRMEIRKDISDRLLPTMPVQYKGIAVVQPSDSILWAEATSEKQIDALDLSFTEVQKFGLMPVTPAAAVFTRHIDLRDIPPASFSPDCDDESATDSIGMDFLTWLWFYSEARGGIMNGFAILIEGPLVLMSEGEGAHIVGLKSGMPELSTEAKSALLSGKKLRRARLTLARGQETWTVTLDAETFVFRGLRLPEGEKLEPVSRFQERMTAIETFLGAFWGMFDVFLKERTNPETWAKTRGEIHQWVTERAQRK